jgi:hypothetical protein
MSCGRCNSRAGVRFPPEYRTAQGTYAEGDLHLDADATEDRIATLLKLTERYCVVAKSLREALPGLPT